MTAPAVSAVRDRTEAALPGGRRLVVRPATVDDVDRLVDLYEHLTADDLHRRFFTVFHPDRRWVTRWIDPATGGAVVLLAELHDPLHSQEAATIGEAGYAPGADGEGELGICVAPGWRGWLGAYLLDALLAAARERGVTTIGADVLAENGPMLALARTRRAGLLRSEDPAVVRVAIPTAP